jgi:hypothetical protein
MEVLSNRCSLLMQRLAVIEGTGAPKSMLVLYVSMKNFS